MPGGAFADRLIELPEFVDDALLGHDRAGPALVLVIHHRKVRVHAGDVDRLVLRADLTC